jgi:hypothetical protein
MTHHLTWGGKNNLGYISLLHPSKLASRQPKYLAEHRLLLFLGKKICHFIHDFHPHWIARLGLPDTNGEHDQLGLHVVERSCIRGDQATISASTPETRHKETKRKEHKTNNQFSVGMSILQSSMDMEAERHLSFLQDKRGQSSVLTEVKKECSHICKMCTFVSFCSQKECSWNICALKVSK